MSNEAIIDKVIARTVNHLQLELRDTHKQFNNMCKRLAHEFEQANGPGFETSSDEVSWRDLKVKIKVYEEALNILSNVDDDSRHKVLAFFFTKFEDDLKRDEAVFKSSCDDMAYSFRQDGGPSWTTSDSESKWRTKRASIRACKDILKHMNDVKGYIL